MDKFDKFLEQFPLRFFPRGKVIFQQGDTPTAGYIIKSGFVKTYDITLEGSEKPLVFDREYEMFPVGWFFGQYDHTLYFHEAHTDCELYVVPREDYMQYISHNADVAVKTLDIFVERYIDFQNRILALEQSKAVDKLIGVFLFLSGRFGDRRSKDRVKITIPLTQQEIANFVGLTRETVATELKRLEQKGVIQYSSQTYLVDIAKLEQLSNT